jgi:hypothetical protein
MSKLSKTAALRASRTAREQVAEQITEVSITPKPAGVQRLTLVLTKGVASRVEDVIHALRDKRPASFGSLTEAALEDFLAKTEDEQIAILERFGAGKRRKFGD